MKRPVFYSLKTVGDVDFWAQAGDSARRTLIMPLSNPREFIAFGVLSPSDEVLFVARGQVLAHMGNFLSRMAQAGASAELYARVPLPGSIVNPYIKDDPHEEKEFERPPTAPNTVGKFTQNTDGTMITKTIENNESNLWTITGSSRMVIVTAVPDPDSASSLVFGMVEVESHYCRANFAAHVQNEKLRAFLDGMPQGTTEEITPPSPLPEWWNDYMAAPFGTEGSLAASTAVAQLGQAASGETRLSLG